MNAVYKLSSEIMRGDFMFIANYSTTKNNLKSHCDQVSDNAEIMKAVKNAEYLDMIDRGIEQLSSGKGQQHELIEAD
jgi:antitoxin YefM